MLQQIAGHVKEAEKSEEIQALLITAVRLVITITYYIHRLLNIYLKPLSLYLKILYHISCIQKGC